jgi:hypothetical protein
MFNFSVIGLFETCELSSPGMKWLAGPMASIQDEILMKEKPVLTSTPQHEY